MSNIQQFDQLKADITLKLSPSLEIKVSDQPSMQKALLAGKEAKHFSKMIEDKRKELVKPLNDQVKAINDYAKSIAAPVLDVESHLKKELMSFERVLEKQRREEQAKLEAEKADKEKELAEKARAEKERLEMEAQFGVDEQDEAAVKRQELVAKAEQEREKAELERQESEAKKQIQSNKVSGARKVWKFEVQVPSEVPREYLVVNETMIRAAVNSGIRDIPGVRIYEDVQIALR